jgi:hypothetical protein
MITPDNAVFADKERQIIVVGIFAGRFYNGSRQDYSCPGNCRRERCMRSDPNAASRIIARGIPVFVRHKLQAEFRCWRITPSFEGNNMAEYRNDGNYCDKDENNQKLHFSVPSI